MRINTSTTLVDRVEEMLQHAKQDLFWEPKKPKNFFLTSGILRSFEWHATRLLPQEWIVVTTTNAALPIHNDNVTMVLYQIGFTLHYMKPAQIIFLQLFQWKNLNMQNMW